MIKIENLSKDYDFTVLSDINLTLPDAGFIGIVGEAAAAKARLSNVWDFWRNPRRGV